jgi:hypothetical protein
LRRTSSRCQRSSVCGVTRNDGHRSLGRARLAVARTTRSNVVSLGRPAVRRRTRSWCCKTMISRSFVASSACGRTSRRVSARTVNESMNSIGGCYGVPGHGANLSFCAPQVGPAASDQVPMPPQQRGRLHQQPAPDRAGQQPRQPSQHRPVDPVNRGRATWHRSTTTSWRNTSSSASLAAELLASSTSHRSTWQNSR